MASKKNAKLQRLHCRPKQHSTAAAGRRCSWRCNSLLPLLCPASHLRLSSCLTHRQPVPSPSPGLSQHGIAFYIHNKLGAAARASHTLFGPTSRQGGWIRFGADAVSKSCRPGRCRTRQMARLARGRYRWAPAGGTVCRPAAALLELRAHSARAR